MQLTTTRVSQRPRRCQRDCGVPIRAGQKAEHTAIPPRSHDVLDSDQWIRLVAHSGACPAPEAMPLEELAAAREEMDAWIDGRMEVLKARVA